MLTLTPLERYKYIPVELPLMPSPLKFPPLELISETPVFMLLEIFEMFTVTLFELLTISPFVLP